MPLPHNYRKGLYAQGRADAGGCRVRRSKVQRQEARRERKSVFGGRGKKKEEKTEPERFTVVRTDDARQGKYLWCAYEGISLEHAERLAAPVPGQEQRYTVIPVEAHRLAREMGEPITAPKALLAYELKVKNEEAA